MDSNKDIYSISSDLELNIKNIKVFRANNEYIAVSTNENTIHIYSINTMQKLYSHDFKRIIDFQFHPKYNNVIAVSLFDSKVILCHINTKDNKIEEKVTYQGNKNDYLLKTIFSPYENGNYLASLFYNSIRIWDMKSHYYIYNMNINDIDKHPKTKWSESGTYLIYRKNKNRLEIFSIILKTIEFHLDNKEVKVCKKGEYIHDFYLLEEKEKLSILIIKNESILLITLPDEEQNNQEMQINQIINYPSILSVESNYDYYNSLLYLFYLDNIILFDIKNIKEKFKYSLTDCEEFFLLNGDNNSKLISKLIIKINDNEFKKESIFSRKDIKFNYHKIDEAPDNFWKGSIEIITNSYDFLSFENNVKDDDDKIKPKKYLSLKEINDELEDSISKETLEDKKKVVKENINKFKKNMFQNISYLEYIKNIIRDNTNTELLINYLLFIKNNDKKLKVTYGENFENFNDEIAQYEACFTQSYLNEKLDYNKEKSEIEKFNDLLSDVSKLEAKKEGQNKLEEFIEEKKKELNKFRFNQPISFNNKELYFCKNRMVIIYSLKYIIKEKKYEDLDNMKYCIKEIYTRNYLKNEKITNNPLKLNIIIMSIACPQGKSVTDYNLNLIDEDNIDTTEEELLKLNFIFNKFNNSYQYEELIIEKDKINKYNLKNIKSYINDPSIILNNYELYKYKDLNDYYKTKYDEEKIRKFIKKNLTSNLFKEAFSFFYGGYIKYPFLEENIAKSFLENHLEFIPFKSETTYAVTIKFTMETFIFLNDDLIQPIFNEKNTKITNEHHLAKKALINGCIVIIFYHELNHNFHNYFYLSKNGYESLKTPRKQEETQREGGSNMERILFGKEVSELTLGQAFYILNEKNYSKLINKFRNEFIMLKVEDFQKDAIFEEYKKLKIEMKETLDYTIIRFKNNRSKNSYNIKSIKIKLKNDAI